MISTAQKIVDRRVAGSNLWLRLAGATQSPTAPSTPFAFTVLESEETVGLAMFDELQRYADEKDGDITIVLLGGRGGQAMYRHIAELAKGTAIDSLLSRINVITQDALAPLPMKSSLSFVRDFERLLGDEFFAKIKSFTPMNTETDDLEGALTAFLENVHALGGIDIFFLGLGPEAEAASHLCYIKPGCGAQFDDFAGIIPISPSILEHHIAKFKVGGSRVSETDEAECRKATSILTLGPAAILSAKRIVQSIVDASTAPAKRASFARMTNAELSTDARALQRQVDENPGLLVRLHTDVRSYVLPDILETNA